MCLLYLLLFGCGQNCCDRGCGCVQERIGSGQNCSEQGCGCVQERIGCYGNSRNDRCCGQVSTYSQSCCCRRDCSGFGRHGGDSVCCDADYYNRQYALCCKCKVRCCCNN